MLLNRKPVIVLLIIPLLGPLVFVHPSILIVPFQLTFKQNIILTHCYHFNRPSTTPWTLSWRHLFLPLATKNQYSSAQDRALLTQTVLFYLISESSSLLIQPPRTHNESRATSHKYLRTYQDCRQELSTFLVLFCRPKLPILMLFRMSDSLLLSITELWTSYHIMFWILLWHALERLFCLTSAGLERMKHVKVFGGRLQRPSPFLIRWAPWRERRLMLSEKGRSCKYIVFWGGNLATLVVSYNNVCSVWIISKIGIIPKRWIVGKVSNFAVDSLERLSCLTSAGLERVL